MNAIGSSSERVEGVRVASRTATSFEVIFETKRIRLYRVLFAITGSLQEAEDMSQEAFLRVGAVRPDCRARRARGLPPSHSDERVPRSPSAARARAQSGAPASGVLSATSCLWIDRYGTARNVRSSSQWMRTSEEVRVSGFPRRSRSHRPKSGSMRTWSSSARAAEGITQKMEEPPGEEGSASGVPVPVLSRVRRQRTGAPGP